MDYLRGHQLNYMLFIGGACWVLSVMTFLTKSLPKKTKWILISMELSAMMLLLFDRYCYIYRGDTSEWGFFVTRFCNGMVYFLSLTIPYIVTRYILDICMNDIKLTRVPLSLIFCDVFYFIGLGTMISSIFTGLYYSIDENNLYQRSPYNFISYIFPLLMVILQEFTIIKHHKQLKKNIKYGLFISILLPSIASLFQFLFFYGISLTTMVTSIVVFVFYTFALNFLSESADRAREHELNYLKESRKKEKALFEQTTTALANAIDAKDKYTRGHSSRVAEYSRQIAVAAGLEKEECRHVYFAGLLHDIGKIGVRYDIINKKGRLTDEEYALVKEHTKIGYNILSSIKNATFLSVGARYHHERYDGKGYPDGVAGEDIPVLARIVTVADAFDTMTSSRSYRDALPIEDAVEELKKGKGTQFDPQFAQIMLDLIEKGEITKST